MNEYDLLYTLIASSYTAFWIFVAYVVMLLGENQGKKLRLLNGEPHMVTIAKKGGQNGI